VHELNRFKQKSTAATLMVGRRCPFFSLEGQLPFSSIRKEMVFLQLFQFKQRNEMQS
jgi:hypothetical protein